MSVPRTRRLQIRDRSTLARRRRSGRSLRRLSHREDHHQSVDNSDRQHRGGRRSVACHVRGVSPCTTSLACAASEAELRLGPLDQSRCANTPGVPHGDGTLDGTERPGAGAGCVAAPARGGGPRAIDCRFVRMDNRSRSRWVTRLTDTDSHKYLSLRSHNQVAMPRCVLLYKRPIKDPDVLPDFAEIHP